MDQIFVETVNIEFLNFSQTSEKEIQFYFVVNGFSYVMFLSHTNGKFEPDAIGHFEFGNDCFFCKHADKKEMTSCELLETHMEELFQHLIELPSMRLHWLYLEHGGEIENHESIID